MNDKTLGVNVFTHKTRNIDFHDSRSLFFITSWP